MEVFTVHRKYAHKERERESLLYSQSKECIKPTKMCAKNENTYTFILLSGYQAYEK